MKVVQKHQRIKSSYMTTCWFSVHTETCQREAAVTPSSTNLFLCCSSSPESEVSDQSVSSFWTQYQQSPSTWFTFSPKTGNEETASLKSTLCPFSCSTCKSDSHLLEGGICFSFNGVRQAGSPVLC